MPRPRSASLGWWGVDEKWIGHEFVECPSALVGRAVGKERAEQRDVDVNEPFGRLVNGDVGAKRAAVGDAVQESCDDRGRQAGDRLRSAAHTGDGGGRSLTIEGLEPRLGAYGFSVSEKPVDDPVGRVAVFVDVGF